MGKHLTDKIRGFTLVELIVVIVVIAILSAIITVSYNGIRQNALSTAIISTAQTYDTALKSYSSINGVYPPVPSEATPSADDRICLGTDYQDHTNDGIPDCGNSGYPSIEYAPFNNALRTLVSIPKAYDSPLAVPYQNNTFSGVTLIREDSFTVNGTSNPYYIMYVVPGGNTDCRLPVVEEVSSSDPFPHMKTSSQKWSWSDGKTTMCVVPLPNPS